ncbi:MAG: PKD domain-containing protein [Bacteroidia bacterium]|nr:PKD domain-containing protein [Bacteroidia bacterium]
MIFRFKYRFLFIAFLSILSWSLGTVTGFAQECNIIYVSPTGASSGAAGTKANPASLPYAFTLVNTIDNQLRLSVGNYSISNQLPMISGITMDGGFDPANNWKKTNSQQTVIFRDSTNKLPNPNRVVAVECSNISNFSIHDITIIVSDVNGISVSAYGIHVSQCSNYNLSRLTVTSGNCTGGPGGVPGIDGLDGANGTLGQPGDEDGGCCTAGGAGGAGTYPGSNNGGAGGAGGSRGSGKGCFFSGSNSAPPGAVGQVGMGIGGGAGGAGGLGVCAAFISVGCDQGPANVGDNGANGADGADGADGANGVIVFGTYFIPGDGQDGDQGVHGGGGGGGGGGGSQGCVNQCVGNYNGSGPGGGGGGEGGQGGFGATGGAGGGGSFAVYIDTNSVNTFLKDCFLNSGLQGDGSLGGTPGGVGGGSSGSGNGGIGCDIGSGGAGGNGGKGGKGGNGGNGVPGVSLPFYEDPEGIAIAQSDMKATVEPAIYVKSGGCTFSDVNYTTNATGIIQWFFDGGSIPLSGSTDSAMTQYATMGRHSITLVVDGVPYMYTDFTGVFSDGTVVLPSVTGSDTVCPGNTETYTAAFPTVFNVLGYEWKMYDPGVSIPTQTGSSPTFTYAFPTTTGKYMITLKTESPCCGWSKIDTFYVHVVPFLNTDVYVSSSAPVICEGQSSSFFAVPLNGGDHPAYQWNVNGTGAGATTNSFTSSTFNDGDAITCIMTSSYPCPINSPVTSLPFVITVNPLPVVTCSSINNYLGGNTVFSEIVAGGTSPYTYNWSFGDGGVDTGAVSTHLYGGTGPYNYSVVVTDSNGCAGICNNTLNIVLPPVVNAGFTFAPVAICGSTSVVFSDTSMGTTTWWQWDFGDGSPTSPLQNPIHIYSIPGNYSVTLIAGNTIYTDTIVSPNIISVLIVPTANISYINDTVCFPLSHQFFDISPGSASWQWNFGDGSTSSTLQNPSHKYSAPGTYNVTLTVTSIDGCPDIATGTVYVLPAPTAAFLQSSTVICSGGSVDFTDASLSAVEWIWNFGDGSTYSGNAPPTHIYSDQGVYNVSLTVKNVLGCYDDTVIIAAVDVNLRPDAAFQMTTTETILMGTDVTLENNSINYNSWLWDLGNGVLDSANFNTTAIYNNPGFYTITLYAIYGPGCLDSMSIGLTVNDIEVIYVPEAFTPNGDNINDVFYVVGNGLKEFKLFIFNRWGEEIFESDDINLGWDGKVQDKLVPQGVYTYRIIYRKNSTPADKLIKIGALLLLKEEF